MHGNRYVIYVEMEQNLFTVVRILLPKLENAEQNNNSCCTSMQCWSADTAIKRHGVGGGGVRNGRGGVVDGGSFITPTKNP